MKSVFRILGDTFRKSRVYYQDINCQYWTRFDTEWVDIGWNFSVNQRLRDNINENTNSRDSEWSEKGIEQIASAMSDQCDLMSTGNGRHLYNHVVIASIQQRRDEGANMSSTICSIRASFVVTRNRRYTCWVRHFFSFDGFAHNFHCLDSHCFVGLNEVEAEQSEVRGKKSFRIKVNK